ncbi:MAG: hypothetical protein FWF45_00035 [Coriobacteriia bacterium]|nr:hypothetical protein [Coriobacteriia bacterium]
MKEAFTPEEFLQLLSQLSVCLEHEGKKTTIILFGGGALSMYYGARSTTHDLDVLINGDDRSSIIEAVRRIAADNDTVDDWLNDDGKSLITDAIVADAQDFITLPAITMKVASAEALLALKAAALRYLPGSHDLEDVRFLIQRLKVTDVEEVITLAEKYLPQRLLPLSAYNETMLDVLIEEINKEGN